MMPFFPKQQHYQQKPGNRYGQSDCHGKPVSFTHHCVPASLCSAIHRNQCMALLLCTQISILYAC